MSILEFILFVSLTLGTTILFDYLIKRLITTSTITWKTVGSLALLLVSYTLTLFIEFYILSLFI